MIRKNNLFKSCCDWIIKHYILSLLICATLFMVLFFSCQSTDKKEPLIRKINKNILVSLGSRAKQDYSKNLKTFKKQIEVDSTNINAHLGVAEINILLYTFGLESRDKTIPVAQEAYNKAYLIDHTDARVQKLAAKLSFINRDWVESENLFLKSIISNPEDLDTRHWYSLFLIATRRTEEAFAQSEIIRLLDVNGEFFIARGSLLYFDGRFEDMKELMEKAVEIHERIPWCYDWLALAYDKLNDYEAAQRNYFKAFELSRGSVEVTAGLGRSLALSGRMDLAKEIADYYKFADKNHYLPPVQRAYIHIGLGEYEEALKLLERAYEEKSWFLTFMQVEHGFDPIRNHHRFENILEGMNFPE